MDPEFEDMRETRDLILWIFGFVEGNLGVLRGLGERVERGFEGMKNGLQEQAVWFGANMENDDHDCASAHGESDHVTTLYSATTLSNLLNSHSSGNLRLETMCNSTWPADFAHDRAAYYFSPQRWVAERYAAYMRRNSLFPGNVLVFTMEVPDHLLPQDKIWKLETDEWKKLIWHSRAGRVCEGEIREMWEKSVGGCIVEPVARSGEVDEFRDMESWEGVREEEHVWKREDGEVAVQYGFVGMRSMERLSGRVGVKWEWFDET